MFTQFRIWGKSQRPTWDSCWHSSKRHHRGGAWGCKNFKTADGEERTAEVIEEKEEQIHVSRSLRSALIMKRKCVCCWSFCNRLTSARVNYLHFSVILFAVSAIVTFPVAYPTFVANLNKERLMNDVLERWSVARMWWSFTITCSDITH